MSARLLDSTPTPSSPSAKTSSSLVESSPQAVISSSSEPFAEAVRLAEVAAVKGKAAKSSAQWLDLAAKWQRASDLMAAVPATDSRYKTAQSRIELYRQNSEAAQQEAQKRRS